MASKQIITFNSNQSQSASYAPNSRDSYVCANSSITRGFTAIPNNLDECFNKFESVKIIAQALGFIKGICGGIPGSCGPSGSGSSGSTKYIYDLWTGAGGICSSVEDNFAPVDVYLNNPPGECNKIENVLGKEWMGCLWGTPSAAYSCTCPKIGDLYYAYLKLRLNVATFWNTPKVTPVKRSEFLDAIKFGKKADVTIAGDFSLKIGQVIELKVDGVSGFPYASAASEQNGLYYILGIKHVITNSGTHETYLSLGQIPASIAGSTAYTTNYP